MASLGMITLGAILNATAFTGGSILGQKLSGQGGEFLQERERHNKAQEKYAADTEKYNEKRQRIYDWKKKRSDAEFTSERDLDMTDSDLQAYSAAQAPVFSNYYRPSPNQKKWELIYIAAGGVAGLAGYFWFL